MRLERDAAAAAAAPSGLPHVASHVPGVLPGGAHFGCVRRWNLVRLSRERGGGGAGFPVLTAAFSSIGTPCGTMLGYLTLTLFFFSSFALAHRLALSVVRVLSRGFCCWYGTRCYGVSVCHAWDTPFLAP